MITVENVVKTFDNKKAVDGISFEVKAGENAVLLGTSGCGPRFRSVITSACVSIPIGCAPKSTIDGSNASVAVPACASTARP